jgi:TonB-dependent receptor
MAEYSDAQTNRSVFGKTLDAESRQALVGATIQILGTGQGTSSDINGAFQINQINGTKGYLVVSYIGYKTDTLPFAFGKEEALLKVIYLRSSSLMLKNAEVEGRLQGQHRAQKDQRTASGIKNIVAIEQMLKFPDLNAAESIGRLPGITLQRDQGEARYVQLRGTPPELSNFNINGEQIPSPEGNVRYVALDVVPIDQLASIEISKALTPDQDGDAIGGAVNLVTRTAQDTIPEIRAGLASGYNRLSEKPQYNAQFAFGQRSGKGGKFGFYANASFSRDRRYGHNMEFNFNESKFSGDTSLRLHYDDVQLRHYDVTRQRTGLSGAWDYKFNPNHKLALNLLYNRLDDDEIRRRVRYNIGAGFLTSETSSREASIDRDMRDRLKIQSIASGNLQGTHKFDRQRLTLDYMLSLSNAREDIPDRLDVTFQAKLINLKIDLSEANWPRVGYPRKQDSLKVFNYNNFKFDKLLQQSVRTNDWNRTARFNLNRAYVINQHHRGDLKIGAKVRLKHKYRESEGKVYHKYYQIFAVNTPFDSIRQIYNSVGPALSLSTVYDGFNDQNFLNKGYELGPTPDPQKSMEFFNFYVQNFKLQESDTKTESFAEDFSADEAIYAAYGMVTHRWRNLMILGGLRYENTQINYTGYDLRFSPFSDFFLGADTLRTKQKYAFWLPQFHLKYSPNEQTNYRAALTWTYSRPNFEDILPYRQSELDSREITQGNPALRFAKSINLDLLWEHYLPRGGLLSAGVFYKRIDNFIYYFEQRVRVENISRPGWYFVTTAQNGLKADVMGAEFNFNHQFYQLPGFWKYFGIYCNYTYTWSQAIIANRDNRTEKINLPGQSPNALNFSVFYESPKFYVRISSVFNDAFLDQLGIRKNWDVYYDRNLNLDLNISYHFTKQFQVYLNGVNLLNTPLKYYLGTPNRVKQQEFYSQWARIGMRLTIN